MIELDPTVVAVLAGAVIPILTGIATKLGTSTSTKATVAFLLSALAGIATEAVADPDGLFELTGALISAAAAFAANLAAYHGIWKPIGEPGVVPLQRVTGRWGIGTTTPTPAAEQAADPPGRGRYGTVDYFPPPEV